MNVSSMPGMAPLSGTSSQSDAVRPVTPRPAPVAGTAPRAVHSAFVPTLLCTLAVCGWLGFQTIQLVNDRAAILSTHAAQQQTVDNAGKLRASLDALAADTQRMAETGNANARTLVEELKRRGVTINVAATSPALPAK